MADTPSLNTLKRTREIDQSANEKAQLNPTPDHSLLVGFISSREDLDDEEEDNLGEEKGEDDDDEQYGNNLHVFFFKIV